MAQASSFQPQQLGSLVGAVAGNSTGQISSDDTYRRYRSGLSIGVFEHGSMSYKRRAIFYEIGRRHSRMKDALSYMHGDDQSWEVDASIPINEAQAANFEGWARKYSNFAPQWTMMDLCGIVERLGKGIAAQSVFGDVNTQHLRAGQGVRVVALGTLDSPQTASTSSVFIPRTVDSVGNDHVFAVLSSAANGEGAAVTTDVLRLDPGNNEPLVPSVGGNSFAQASVEALRVLGANFEESGAGDLFSYALTRGIHSVVSVVAHTDEGGWMRSLLRGGSFRVPYGGINQSLRAYPALPPLAGSGPSYTSAWVDAVALKTAAAVAHCDPCVTVNGGLYPTVFTSSQGDLQPPGNSESNPTLHDGQSIGRQISGDGSRFAPLYIRALNYIFGRSTNSGVAESHMCSILNQVMYNAEDRHLQHKTVAPYFWIEPTSLIPRDMLGSEAERGGFGSLVTPGTKWDSPYFERFYEMDKGRNANFTTIAFKMRTARTAGLVAAYAGTPAELAGLKLYQFDEDSIVLAGDQGPTIGDVPTKHAQADPLSSYLWRRGQSPLPAPAELINIQGSYAAKYKIVDWDDNFDATVGDVPEVWEMEQHGIEWRVTVPTALAAGKSNYATPDARRARSRAAIALAQASLRSRGYGEANSPVIAVSNSPPPMDEPRLPDYTNWNQMVHSPNPGPTTSRGDGNPSDHRPEERGPSLNPVPHHQPLRGAPYPRQGGGQLVGGSLPPVPPQGPQGGSGDGGPPNNDPPAMEDDHPVEVEQGQAGADPAPAI